MIAIGTFKDREEHLRQRAARGWYDDEDIIVCLQEIDRLAEACARMNLDKCPTCGATETVEIGGEQSIRICAGCGSDEP